MTHEALEPCPFCKEQSPAINCPLCTVSGLMFYTEAEAVTAWNNRLPNPLQAEVDALRAIIDNSAELNTNCPLCGGVDLNSAYTGEFCIAGCRSGKVLKTTAAVLQNLKPWLDEDAKALAALRVRVAELEGLLTKAGPFVGWAAGLDLVLAGVLADTLCDEIDAALKEPTP